MTLKVDHNGLAVVNLTARDSGLIETSEFENQND